MLIYFDSVIMIYLLDDEGPRTDQARARLAALLNAGGRVAVSDLVRMECLVKPIRSGDEALAAKFAAFFEEPDVALVPLTSAVFDRAASIRAHHGFRTPDAIHLAAAVEGGCGTFLTNDRRLGRFDGLGVEVLG